MPDSTIEPFDTTEPEPWLPEGTRTMMRVEVGKPTAQVARVQGRRRVGPNEQVTIEGELRMFDPEGALFGVARYDEGVANGETRFFYPDGTLKSRRVYENGRPHGFFEDFREDGTPEGLTIYRHGEGGGRLTLHPDGQPATFQSARRGPTAGGNLRRWGRDGQLIGGAIQTDLLFDRDEMGRLLNATIRVSAGHLVIQLPASDREFIALIPNDDDGERVVTLPVDAPDG